MICSLCPRKCGVDRSESRGFCGMGEEITAAKAMLHFWEEPCISGSGENPRGSGAVFFSGCVMKCVYCQNYQISAENSGKAISAERLAEIFLELQAKGALNINLVNPTHFVPQIIKALKTAKSRSLKLPIVYNTGGYERVETLKALDGYADIFLPDVKYFSDELSVKLSKAPRYFETALAAVRQMLQMTGKPQFNADGVMTRGVIVRHLILPGCCKDSLEIIRRLAEFKDDIVLSLMRQYTPFGLVKSSPEFKSLNRRLTTFEYNKVLDEVIRIGFHGFTQEKSSAREEYTPLFDFDGL